MEHFWILLPFGTLCVDNKPSFQPRPSLALGKEKVDFKLRKRWMTNFVSTNSWKYHTFFLFYTSLPYSVQSTSLAHRRILPASKNMTYWRLTFFWEFWPTIEHLVHNFDLRLSWTLPSFFKETLSISFKGSGETVFTWSTISVVSLNFDRSDPHIFRKRCLTECTAGFLQAQFETRVS